MALLALIATGCKSKTNQPAANDNANSATTTNTNGDVMKKNERKLNCTSQKNSGEQGTATLTDVEGGLEVAIALTGAPAGIAQPAHIHVGSCATIGSVRFPLVAVTNGVSKTKFVNMTIDELLKQSPLAINVHKSESDIQTYVACADVTGDVMEKKTGDAMNKNEDVMKKDETAMNKNTNGDVMKKEVKEFTVTAKNFSFSLNEIKVNKGDTVKINFTNADGFHDWVIDEFNARTKQIGAGMSESIQFTADKTGTFEYYCSVGQHRQFGMKGNLIVQ